MPEAHHYILRGDPIPYMRARSTTNLEWDKQKEQRTRGIIEIDSQHDGKSLFTGPLHIEATFYFRLTSKRKDSSIDKIKPSLVDLMRFIEVIATDILFENISSITSISTRKLYDTQARTEFSIIQLSKEDKNANKKKQ